MSKMKVNKSVRDDPHCPHCGGMFSAGGTRIKKLPIGFGFANSNRFQVDRIVIKSYVGFCFDCGKDGEVEFARGYDTVYPKV